MAESQVEFNVRDEEDEEEETDSEEEDEEDVEPKLKYERMGNDLTNIFSKDAASCMTVHSKFLALGTHWGVIHILDHLGNNVREKELPAHTTIVNQISIDDNGDYIASCSDDGRVLINGLYSTDNNQCINFDRPIKAVAMDPNFYKPGSGKHFITGDDKLILNQKTFLGRYKTIEIHKGEGPIRNIRWTSHFIAWANDTGVKVYDMSSSSRISYIARENPSLRPEMYRCSLCWKDDRTLLIGWGDHIKVCMVKDRVVQDTRDLPSRYVEIVAMFRTDFMVCGLAPYEDNLVVLSYDEEGIEKEGTKMIAQRPNLRVIEPHMNYYDEISNDALSIKGFQNYRCNDYQLECLPTESMYFIISPKEVVLARQRDHDDHITWLVEHELYEEAMAAATQHSKDLKLHNVKDLGIQYLDHLLNEGSYEAAAQLCVKILGKNKELWEEQAIKFAPIHQLKVIAPYLPRSEPRLSPGVYEMVINDFLNTDHVGFQKLISEWPCDLYDIKTIVNAVLDKLDRQRDNAVLLQCLADLYAHDKRYDKALGIYIRLRHRNVFNMIRKHDLFDKISDKIVLLMEFDKITATDMLLDNMNKIPIDKVVHQLDNEPALLHVYLDHLFQRDPHAGEAYHPKQVRLYAEFDRPKLLPFLRTSRFYDLQAALVECQIRNLTTEQVFLLGRMGNTKQALKIITNDLRDVNQAIEFCKEQNDSELWDDLIKYSLDKPTFITGLLQNIGTHVDPIRLIRQIRPGLEIPGLRDSLVQIMQDYNLHILLREGCQKILASDSYGLMDRLVKTQRKALSVRDDQSCQQCQQRLMAYDIRYTGNIVVFHCHHTFHEDCLPADATDLCMICSDTKSRRGPGTSFNMGS